MTKKQFYFLLDSTGHLDRLKIGHKQYGDGWVHSIHVDIYLNTGKGDPWSYPRLQGLRAKHYSMLNKEAKEKFNQRIASVESKYEKWLQEYKRKQPGIVRIA